MKKFDEQMFEQGFDITGVERKDTCFVGIETKYWLYDDSFLYKLDDEHCYGFGELAMSYFSKILGFDCVNAYPAVDFSRHDSGVIIESFLDDKDSVSKPLYDILDAAGIERGYYPDSIIRYCTPNDVLDAEDLVREYEGLCFEEDIEYKLKQMAIVDFLFCQYDRHANNIEFVIKRDPKTGQNILCLAPLFDNGRILGIGKEQRYDYDSAYNVAKELLPKFCIYDKAKEDRYLPVVNISKCIAKEIAKDERLKQFFDGFMQLDMREHLEYICEVGGYEFSERQLAYMTKVFDIRKKMVERQLTQLQTKGKYVNKQSFSQTTETSQHQDTEKQHLPQDDGCDQTQV